MRKVDVTGERFGRLVALRRIGVARSGGALWECRCDCGVIKGIALGNLKASTRSCGCLASDVTRARSVRHGMFVTPTYTSWSAMMTRCRNSNSHAFKRYGGRGITVCERWLGEHGFENFLSDMGVRPDGRTLDRIDPNGNYEPSNCRWATGLQQRRNRRDSLAEHEVVQIRWLYGEGGFRQAEIARAFGLTPTRVGSVVSNRVYAGVGT